MTDTANYPDPILTDYYLLRSIANFLLSQCFNKQEIIFRQEINLKVPELV